MPQGGEEGERGRGGIARKEKKLRDVSVLWESNRFGALSLPGIYFRERCEPRLLPGIYCRGWCEASGGGGVFHLLLSDASVFTISERACNLALASGNDA